jgi:3-deoxy-manno-octulosonate cytidylyltransferase (CMP-KDO synthetase)
VLIFDVPVVSPAGLPPSIQQARVVAIVPARYASTRLPGKPLALIAGKPMVEHVYARAAAAPTVEAVIVATDDERIAEAVRAFGGIAVMTRADHATGTDRLAEVAQSLAADIIVNVQGDEPLIDAEAIDACVRALLARPDDVMSTARRPLADRERQMPSVVKVVADRDGLALYFSREAIPHVRAGQPAPAQWAHLGLYAYRREFLLSLAGLAATPLERAESLEQLRVLEHGYRIRCVDVAAGSPGVDTPEDLETVRTLLSSADKVNRS